MKNLLNNCQSLFKGLRAGNRLTEGERSRLVNFYLETVTVSEDIYGVINNIPPEDQSEAEKKILAILKS